MCDYLPDLIPMQGESGQPFLWKAIRNGASVSALTRGWNDPSGEYERLVVDITLQHPLEVVRTALVDTFVLLLARGETLISYTSAPAEFPFDGLYASYREKFEKAKQQQSALLPQHAVNVVAQLTTLGSALLLTIFAVAGIQRDIILLTLGTWIANATVHATLVGAYPRYQDKVNWLLPLILLSTIAERQTARRGIRMKARDSHSRATSVS